MLLQAGRIRTPARSLGYWGAGPTPGKSLGHGTPQGLRKTNIKYTQDGQHGWNCPEMAAVRGRFPNVCRGKSALPVWAKGYGDVLLRADAWMARPPNPSKRGAAAAMVHLEASPF